VGSEFDQRNVPTSRAKLGELQAAPDTDDVDTDSSLGRVDPNDSVAATDADLAPLAQETPWRLNALGAALLALLACSVLLNVALKMKLTHARTALAEAESEAEDAESAAAREPAGADKGTLAVQPRVAPTAAVPSVAEVAQPTPEAAAEPTRAEAPKREQLILLLTVGTEHYAEKQLRRLMQKCKAPLAVYRQKRGRCGWSQCFAVALPASEAESARGCGHVVGQSVRDRDDFTTP